MPAYLFAKYEYASRGTIPEAISRRTIMDHAGWLLTELRSMPGNQAVRPFSPVFSARPSCGLVPTAVWSAKQTWSPQVAGTPIPIDGTAQ
jgi:hypothetical protein